MSILSKIHQTYRLLYLKDVVLARTLEDSTFNMLNSFIFFNNNDIVSHVQNNQALLREVFQGFWPGDNEVEMEILQKDWIDQELARRRLEASASGIDPATITVDSLGPPPPIPTDFADAHKQDVVLFLHSLLLMSKNIPMPTRLALVRTLLDQGLIHVLEWAFSFRSRAVDDQIANAAVEMLTHALDHDPSAVRSLVLKEHERAISEMEQDGKSATAGGGSPTLVVEMIKLLVTPAAATVPPAPTKLATGLKSQLADAVKQLLDTGEPESAGVSSFHHRLSDLSS